MPTTPPVDAGRSGTRYGPNSVRQASAQLRWEEKHRQWASMLASDISDIPFNSHLPVTFNLTLFPDSMAVSNNS